MLGAIEAGGTKFVCAMGTLTGDIVDEIRFPTTTPDETLGKVIEYFSTAVKKYGHLKALGIGSFGPVDLNYSSPSWGYITATPKPGWKNTNFAPFLGEKLNVPVAFDTDVNAAALAEYRWGTGRGMDTIVYLTIGTGIGGGIVIDGKTLHGLVHPEIGHILLSKREDDSYDGTCPYHGHCFEGLAAGPSLLKRWGQDGASLAIDHPAWDLEAHYLASGLQTILCMISPNRIILGGGVSAQAHLLPMVGKKLLELNNGYIVHPSLSEKGISDFICLPGLGDKAGIKGSFALAMDLMDSKK